MLPLMARPSGPDTSVSIPPQTSGLFQLCRNQSSCCFHARRSLNPTANIRSFPTWRLWRRKSAPTKFSMSQSHRKHQVFSNDEYGFLTLDGKNGLNPTANIRSFPTQAIFPKTALLEFPSQSHRKHQVFSNRRRDEGQRVLRLVSIPPQTSGLFQRNLPLQTEILRKEESQSHRKHQVFSNPQPR